jgi:hypothetical protein
MKVMLECSSTVKQTLVGHSARYLTDTKDPRPSKAQQFTPLLNHFINEILGIHLEQLSELRHDHIKVESFSVVFFCNYCATTL